MNYKSIISIVVFALACLTLSAQSQQKRLEQHLYYLASDSLRGRLGGSDDAMKAAQYIVEQYEAMGIEPFYQSGYLQPFTNTMFGEGRTFNNIIAWIPGSDPALRDEYVIIGAHYDHLGVRKNKIYNGADDNASGTSAVIEIARQLKAHQKELKRSVIIANFDGEELGLLGSNYFAERLSKEKRINKVCIMMSVDMVGWYRQSGKLIIQGVGTVHNGKAMLTEIADLLGVNIKTKKFERSVMTATDTEGFAKKGVPTLAITTGLKSPYHKPEDDADLIDYKGLNDISDYLTRFTSRAAEDELFRSSGRVAKKHQSSIQPFDLGIALELGDSRLHHPYGCAVDGRSRFAWNIGLTAQVNFKCKWLALRLNPMYGWSMARYIDTANFLNHSKRYYQEGLTVPLSIVFQKNTNYGIPHAGIGLYYTRVFKGGIIKEAIWSDINKNQLGLEWDLGWRFHGLDLSVYGRYQFNHITDGTIDPNTAHLRNFYSGVRLSYYFL